MQGKAVAPICDGHFLQCVPIAQKAGTAVWKVQLSEGALSSNVREQIYNKLASRDSKALENCPLVIFVSFDNTRSLWCQSSARNGQKNQYTSALYVSEQPISLWKFRLGRLAKSGEGLLRSFNPDAFGAFESRLESLYFGITGISNQSDRWRYVLLTLQRLILIQAVQKKGWLNQENWYLQTRFEAALQTEQNFFATWLQPLYQSLALPKVERPIALEPIGEMPFLGYLFQTHRLEQIYTDITIHNQPFEEILGWLSEQASIGGLNPWLSDDLGECLERQSARSPTSISAVELAEGVGDRAIGRLLNDRLQFASNQEDSDEARSTDLNTFLFNIDAKTCRYLIQEVLPSLRILDPACGSGNLLAAIYRQLTEIFSILIGYSYQNQDRQISIWQAGLAEGSKTAKHSQLNIIQAVQHRILKNNIYGVDVSMQAAESTIFQLLLHTIATAQHTQDIEPLVDLSFNILSGNSLIGLINVDEERFEKISTSGESEFLQGNLLQPLVAESYQTILAEKNLAVEHYKYRNQMLADARNVPDYARAALLKEEILRLDIKAQNKLDRLLLQQMSQQLGIQYKVAQLTEKPRRRPLTLEDIDVLQPFHWGYHFNQVLNRGGFDIVVCAPPQGAFKPTAAEFLQRFQDLAEVKGENVRSLKTSKQALAQGDPEIAQAWLFYQDQYAYVADYFYRSEQYNHQNPTVGGKVVRNQLSRERLFLERCVNLLAPKGIGIAIIEKALLQQPKSETLRKFIEKTKQIEILNREGDCLAT